MNAHRIETTFNQDGTLTLNDWLFTQVMRLKFSYYLAHRNRLGGKAILFKALKLRISIRLTLLQKKTERS